MSKHSQKEVAREVEKEVGVVAFGKYRWEQVSVKRDGKKYKPTKRSNSNYLKIKNYFKRENKTTVRMVGKQVELLKKIIEEHFNYLGLIMSNI